MTLYLAICLQWPKGQQEYSIVPPLCLYHVQLLAHLCQKAYHLKLQSHLTSQAIHISLTHHHHSCHSIYPGYLAFFHYLLWRFRLSFFLWEAQKTITLTIEPPFTWLLSVWLAALSLLSLDRIGWRSHRRRNLCLIFWRLGLIFGHCFRWTDFQDCNLGRPQTISGHLNLQLLTLRLDLHSMFFE